MTFALQLRMIKAHKKTRDSKSYGTSVTIDLRLVPKTRNRGGIEMENEGNVMNATKVHQAGYTNTPP